MPQAPFELTSEEVARLKPIEDQVDAALRDWLGLMRVIARERGYIANELKDLKAPDGGSYTQIQTHDVSRAKSGNHMAFYCGNEQTGEIGCGWVRLRPINRRMSGPLGGQQIYCPFCDRNVTSALETFATMRG